jgi:hypothetical protein
VRTLTGFGRHESGSKPIPWNFRPAEIPETWFDSLFRASMPFCRIVRSWKLRPEALWATPQCLLSTLRGLSKTSMTGAHSS